MSRYKDLAAIGLAVMLSFGLVACGGGGGGGSDPAAEVETPDPAIAERAGIESAITMARTAVDGLTDDASDTAMDAADMAVAYAKKAVTDAANVPAGEKSAFNTAIEVIGGNLSTKTTSIAAARETAADTMKADMAKTGKAMHAALGGPDAATQTALNNIGVPTLSEAGLAIDAAKNRGAFTDDADPDSVTLKAGASAGALGSWMGMDYALMTGTGNDKVTNEARVYTNQGASMSQAFGDVHKLTNAGNLVVSANNVGLVMATDFTHSGTQTHPKPERIAAVYISGTYDGAAGEYSCTDKCTSTNDGSGAPSSLGGTWTFTPDKGAMVSDSEYLYYGWWVSKDHEGMPTAASAFAGVVKATGNSLDRAENLAKLSGSATYAGNAAGKFAMSNPLDSTGDGGHFTADAMLSAIFGAVANVEDAGVTGTIDNFRLNDGSEDPGWSVSLARSGLDAAGAITAPAGNGTVWSINGNKALASGTWSGTMYDEMVGNPPGGDGSNIPTTVTGTFYSEFSSIGRMVGAFGADKEE